jgi:hypothetical protein
MLTTHSGVGSDPISVHPSSVRPYSVQFSSVHTLIIFPYYSFPLSCVLQPADVKDFFFLVEILNAVTLHFPLFMFCVLQPDLTEP